MRMIAIIDYDAGNIKSVEKALKYLGEDAVITRDREEILSADKVILPGVGAFGDAMYNLKKYGLDEVLREVAKRQIPLLGICLGLQLLFERSDETPGVEGLGFLHLQANKYFLNTYQTVFINNLFTYFFMTLQRYGRICDLLVYELRINLPLLLFFFIGRVSVFIFLKR